MDNSKTKKKSRWGGERPNSGRPRSEVLKLAKEIEKLPADIEETLNNAFKALTPDCVLAIARLAAGGTQRVEEKYQPSGLVVIEDVARDRDGNPILDRMGRPTVIERPLYPDKPVEEMILVERSVSVAEPDLKANTYIVDRILGRPRQSVQVDTGPKSIRDIIADAEARAASHRPDTKPQKD